MESATEQQTTRSWEQIRNLNSTGLFDDQLTYLRADEADLDTAKQNVERANQELDSAKDSHSETLKEFKASRHDVAVEIAELEVVDPVKRAIWANSFYLTEKVADPIRFGMEMEILVDQVGEKLSIGTPVLIQRPDGISISRIEVPGLVTNLSTEQAAPWDKSSNGKKISKGDIATNPVFTLSITTNNGPFLSKESFGHDEKPLTVKLWHDGDDNIARVRSNFIDEKFGIIIGNDHVQQYIEGIDEEPTKDTEFYRNALEKNRYWTYVGASQLGCEFPGFDQTPRYQEWKDKTLDSFTGTFRRLATGEKRYEDEFDARSRHSSPRESHGLEIWPKEYLLATLRAFDIAPEQVKEKVRASLDNEPNTALQASQKVRALADLDQIFELLNT